MSITAYTQTIDTLVFHDNFAEGHYFQIPSLSSRSKMISNKRHGVIAANISYPSTMNDDERNVVDISFAKAKEIWEQYLNGDSLSIDVIISDDHITDIYTEVYYFDVSGIALPLSLARKKGHTIVGATVDAKIYIRDISNWQTGFDRQGKQNLTLAFMRSIAVAMGFGSSLHIGSKNFIVAGTRNYSPTDNMISTLDGMKLNTIDVPRNRKVQMIEDYARSVYGNPYIMSNGSNYKLYAPSNYEDGASMRLLNEPNLLMSYQLPDSMEAVVDDVTITLLNEIGWRIITPQLTSLNIACDDADSTGVTSAYESHLFYLQGEISGITQPFWTFEMPLASGGMQTVATSNIMTLSIPALTNESNYSHTEEGRIVGRVTFTALKEGEEVQLHYYISLELKSHIISVSAGNIEPNEYDEDLFDIDVFVHYTGCYYLFLSAREEFVSGLRGFYSGIPYYTTFHLNGLDAWGDVWLTITAINSYGSTTATYEIPCTILSRRPATASISKVDSKQIREISIFDLNGKIIAKESSLEKLFSICTKGQCYILQVKYSDGETRKIKYVKE